MSDLSTTIETAAGNPAEAMADNQSVKAQPLPDLIAVDQYLAAKSGAARKTRGIRITKLIMPGQVGNISDRQAT